MQHAIRQSCNLARKTLRRFPRLVTSSHTMTVNSPERSLSTGAPSPLMTPVKLGALHLSHRIAMSPMTRLRMSPGTELPNDLVGTYYEQRASKGGLIISECNYVARDGRGYVRGPGMATDEQAAAWRPITDRVHAKGGFFFVQMYHAGRATHSSMIGGQTPVSPSPLGMAGSVFVEGGVRAAYEVPREMTMEEVQAMPGQWAKAAERAVKLGGADGVEVHCANGYLLHTFVAKKTNLRTDAYGGSLANRCRLLLEVLDSVAAAVGPERVGLKLGPGITFSDLIEPEEDVRELLDYMAPELAKRKLAYVNIANLNGEPYASHLGLPGPNVKFDMYKHFRAKGYDGTMAINGHLTIEAGEQYVADGVADVVVYGSPFIANANLPDLVAAGVKTAGLNHGGHNPKIWYSMNPAEDAKGYTDWPLVEPKQPHAA